MKRRGIKLCMFLVLGAVVNVAVAWGCAISHNRARGLTDLPTIERQHIWERYAPSNYPKFDVESRGSASQRFGSTWRMVAIGPPPFGFLVGRSEFGWPCRALFGVIDSTDPTTGSTKTHFRGFATSPIRYSHPQFHSGKVPAWISWPGFAINTVFYASILWLFAAAPFTVRRHLRRRRNLCPQCAYPVGTNEVCTECGATLATKPANAKMLEGP